MSLKNYFYSTNNGMDDQIAKEASQHGMTTDQYLRAVAQQQAEEEYLQKQAQENEWAEGILRAEGIRKGIEQEILKVAHASGGDMNSARVLASIFNVE